MKLSYFADTDTLHIAFAAGASVNSTEISDGVVADSDAAGRLLGLEVEQASARIDVTRLETVGLPIAHLLAA